MHVGRLRRAARAVAGALASELVARTDGACVRVDTSMTMETWRRITADDEGRLEHRHAGDERRALADRAGGDLARGVLVLALERPDVCLTIADTAEYRVLSE